ncbi:unnamed protein product [Closterium sp. NIES-54]
MPRPCPGPALLIPVVAHQGPVHRPPLFSRRLNRRREGRPGGGHASEQPPLVQPPLEQPPRDPEQPPLAPGAAAPGAAAPGAAAPGPRAATPGPWSSHPWPLEQQPLAPGAAARGAAAPGPQQPPLALGAAAPGPSDAAPGPGAAASMCCPLPPVAARCCSPPPPLLRLPSARAAVERRVWGWRLNLWPRVSLPGTSPTLRWTGEVGDASVFRVWVSRAFVRDTSADKLSARAIPCVFLGFVPDAPGWQFYHPTSRRVFPSQDVTFNESVPFYRLFPYRSAPPPPPPLFLAPGPPPIDPLLPQGPAPSVVSQVDPLPGTAPIEVAVGLGAATGVASGGGASGGAEPGGAGSGGAELGGEEPGGAEPEGVEPRCAESEGAESGGAEPRGAASCGDAGAGGVGVTAGARDTGGTAAAGPGGARTRGAGAAGIGGVGGAGAGDPTEPGATGAGGSCAGGASARGAVAGGAGVGGTGAGGAGAAGARAVDPGAGGARDTVRPRPYFVPPLQQVLGVPSSTALTPPLLCPPPDESQLPLQPASPVPAPSPYTEQSGGLTERREPASRPVLPVRTARRIPRSPPPPVPGTHTMALHPSFNYAAASALVAELLDFAAACCLDYATALVAESESASPPSIGGECALGTDVLEDRQEDFECLAATVPRFASMLLALEGDPDAPHIPTHALTQRRLRVPREWHDTLRTTLADLGFAPATADPSLFLRTDTSLLPFYVLVYVNDFVFATADTEALTLVKSELQNRHTCTDLGELRSYLGLQITRDRARRTITLTQSHMVDKVLQRFGFQFSSPQPTPLSTSHSLSAPPSDESVEPSGMGLVLGGRGPVVLTGHADASWVDESASQRSSQGYTFSLGSGSVSLRSTRSSLVLSSSCEAEIYARAMAAQELRWLTYVLTDLGEQPRSPPFLYVDNKAMIALCQEHILEHITKHIALRYFLARELQQRGQLRLSYVATRANTADIFTKALPPGDHQRFSTLLGLVPTLPHLLTA